MADVEMYDVDDTIQVALTALTASVDSMREPVRITWRTYLAARGGNVSAAERDRIRARIQAAQTTASELTSAWRANAQQQLLLKTVVCPRTRTTEQLMAKGLQVPPKLRRPGTVVVPVAYEPCRLRGVIEQYASRFYTKVVNQQLADVPKHMP